MYYIVSYENNMVKIIDEHPNRVILESKLVSLLCAFFKTRDIIKTPENLCEETANFLVKKTEESTTVYEKTISIGYFYNSSTTKLLQTYYITSFASRDGLAPSCDTPNILQLMNIQLMPLKKRLPIEGKKFDIIEELRKSEKFSNIQKHTRTD